MIRITHWLFPLLTACAILFFHYSNNFVVETLRLKSFDLLQQQDEYVLSNDIGIVTIDEASIEKYGQWPWKRDVLSDIIWQLREAGAGIIVLPMLFSEDDRLGGDSYLQDALTENGVVIAQAGSLGANKNAVPRGVAMIGDPLPWLFEWPGMLGPIQDFHVADGVGVINVAPEIDGVVRRVTNSLCWDRDYPTQLKYSCCNRKPPPIKANEGGVEKIRVPRSRH